MDHEELPDLDELAIELVQLRHRRSDLLNQYEKALERIAAFPNEFQQTRAAALATSLDEMTARIEWLEAQLLPLRRHDDV
jgi:chromosome segregation ATPase